MAGENTITTANGLYKKRYSKSGLNNVKPKSAVLQEKYPYSASERVGESYNEGVELQGPNGFTYAGSAGGVNTLNSASNMVIKPATITPHELDLREQISYTAMSRAVEQGETAFGSLTDTVLAAMKTAHHNRVEGCLLHGQRGYGTIESSTDVSAGTVMDVVITAETWAPGLWWAYGVGSRWDAFTGTTKNNAGAVLTVTAITASTRTIRFSYSGTLATEATAGDVLYPQGAWDGTTYTEMLGLLSQAANTGSMHGIDAATYPNWKGNTKAVGGALTFSIVEEFMSELRDRGAGEASLSLYLSNLRYSNLVNEMVQFKMISAEAANAKAGFRSVSLNTPKMGEVSIIAHPFMKQGEGLILPDDEVKRSGSSDVAFGIPGSKGGDVFFHLEGYTAIEARSYCDQFALLRKPGWAGVLTGITSGS